MRVSGGEYEDLRTAAHLLGGTSTQVARMLVNAGVRRLLAEHDVAIDEAHRAGTLEA